MTDTTTPPENKTPDWAKLAQEALDLWQDHLQSLAQDTKAKEEMARFVAPMGSMVAQWTSMMQQGFHGTNPPPASATAPRGGANTDSPNAAAHAGVHPAASPVPDNAPSPEPSAAAPEPAAKQAGADATGSASDANAAAPAAPAVAAQAQSGRTGAADSAHDLAQLANRLAELERLLDDKRRRTS